MKRIIPLLILAFVIAACQEDGPTVPTDGPQFAKPTCPSDHPSCKDGGGGGGGEYIPTTLGETKVTSKARDLTEPLGDGSILIAGVSQMANGDPVAAVWTVSGTDVVASSELPLGDGFAVSAAIGINDDGSVIVGVGGSGVDVLGHITDEIPVMWTRSGDGWATELLPGYEVAGWARDVNAGTIVGTTWHSGDSKATLWDATTGAVVAELLSWDPSPYAHSDGKAINSQGYVVGFGTTAYPNGPPWHAMLWRPDGSYCDLHEAAGWGEDSKSIAIGISDVTADGKILVAGGWRDAVIWEVNPTDCAITVLQEVPSADAHDVSVNGEAVGMSPLECRQARASRYTGTW
jgi:hypothetical protein